MSKSLEEVREHPVQVRYMSPYEEFRFPNWPMLTVYYPEDKSHHIAMRKSCPPEKGGLYMSHEIGHIKYPVAAGVEEHETTKGFVRYLFGELIANYYELMKNPESNRSKYQIRYWRDEAKSRGLTDKQFDRLERIARRRIGYRGRRVR